MLLARHSSVSCLCLGSSHCVPDLILSFFFYSRVRRSATRLELRFNGCFGIHRRHRFLVQLPPSRCRRGEAQRARNRRGRIAAPTSSPRKREALGAIAHCLLVLLSFSRCPSIFRFHHSFSVCAFRDDLWWRSLLCVLKKIINHAYEGEPVTVVGSLSRIQRERLKERETQRKPCLALVKREK